MHVRGDEASAPAYLSGPLGIDRVNRSGFITPAQIWLAVDCNTWKVVISSARWRSFPTAVCLVSLFSFPCFIHHHTICHWLKCFLSGCLLLWKLSCFLICYKEWKLLWRLKQLAQWKIPSESLPRLTLTWHCSYSDEASGRTWLLSLHPSLLDITQGPATTWRLMMATSAALHSLVNTESNCLMAVSHIPFYIPYVLRKSSNGAKFWPVGGLKWNKRKEETVGLQSRLKGLSILHTVIMRVCLCSEFWIRYAWLEGLRSVYIVFVSFFVLNRTRKK